MSKSNKLQDWYHNNITKGQRILLWLVVVFIAFVGLIIASDISTIGLLLFSPIVFLVYLALGSKV